MASLTRWTWVWVNCGSWWWTGRPGVLWFMGSQRVGHNWATETELNWNTSYVDVYVYQNLRVLVTVMLCLWNPFSVTLGFWLHSSSAAGATAQSLWTSSVGAIPKAAWHCCNIFSSWRVRDGGQKLLGLDLSMPLAAAAPADWPVHQPLLWWFNCCRWTRSPASASITERALGRPAKSLWAFSLSFVQKEQTLWFWVVGIFDTYSLVYVR